MPSPAFFLCESWVSAREPSVRPFTFAPKKAEKLVSPCSEDETRADEKSVRIPPSLQEILRDFAKLIEERKLFGVELAARFLISAVPSMAKLLRRWAKVFGNAISPCNLFAALSARTPEFEQRKKPPLVREGPGHL